MIETALRSELDRLFAVPDAQPDWQRVLRDAGISQREPPRRPLFGFRRARTLVLAFALLALVMGGLAVAGTHGWGPLSRIAAADHTQTRQDVLDPALTAELQQHTPSTLRFLFGTSRLVGQLPDGRRVYVISTSTQELCVLVTRQTRLGSFGCGNPLTQTQPTTITSECRICNGPNATPPLIYGIAQNGITAVTFIAKGKPKTVPVKNNVWAYEGTNRALDSLTVRYTDGTTRTLTHGVAQG